LFDTLVRLGKNLDKSTTEYNRLVGALNQRVLVSAKRMKELGLRTQKRDPLKEAAILENRPRQIEAGAITPDLPDGEKEHA